VSKSAFVAIINITHYHSALMVAGS